MLHLSKYLRALFLLILILASYGCAADQAVQTVLREESHRIGTINEGKRPPYLLQPGDVLEVKFYYNPELNEHVTIRPDGMISLQLIGDVVAAGLQPSALHAALVEQYSKLLSIPKVSVIVKDFAGQKLYVAGEVKNPGIFPVWGNMTVLQAVAQAGGFLNSAELENVIVLRNQGGAEPLYLTINLKRIITSREYGTDLILKPYDIVFLPKSTIAEMNQFVEQYIDKLIPVSRSLGLFYNLNPTVQVK